MNHNVFREVRLYARDERAGSELRKGMVAPVGSNDVMTCLRAAVVAYDNPRLEMAGQEIGEEAFTGVSKTKIYYDVGAQGENTPVKLNP
jgi:hypothetical protein